MLLETDASLPLVTKCKLNYVKFSKPGGLNLSWSCLDRESRSRQKKLISTVWKTTSWQLRFSRQFKNQVSTVLTTLKIKISWFVSRSRSRVLILTKKSWSWQSRKSQQFEKRHRDMSRNLDLDRDCSIVCISTGFKFC